MPALLGALDERSEGSEFVVGYVAEGLATFNEHEAIEPLIRYLDSESYQVVEAVQEALVVLARGCPQVLFEAARDPHALIRARAVTILGEVGDQASAPVLVAAAADEDKGVRDAARAAVRALRRVGVDVSVPSRTLQDRIVGVGRFLGTYFVLPSVQGFSPYRTGAGVHLLFSVSVGCSLGVLSQVWLGLDTEMLVGAVVAAVTLL